MVTTLFRVMLMSALMVTAAGGSRSPSYGAGVADLRELDLPAAAGRHVGRWRTAGMATHAGSSERPLISAKLRIRGRATLGHRVCCPTGPDSGLTPYFLVATMTDASGGPQWVQMMTLEADGPFDLIADFGEGGSDSSLALLGASLDTVVIVGGWVRQPCCEDSGREPEVTIGSATLVLEHKSGTGQCAAKAP